MGFAAPTLYLLQHSTDFHDITTGTNSGGEAGIGYAAHAGFDFASGRGSLIQDAALADITINHLANQVPVANFSYVMNNLSVNFKDVSTDIDGTIVAHAWTFGDGSTSAAANPVHAYFDNGNYTVTETVTDDKAASASKTWIVPVVVSTSSTTSTPKAGVGITPMGPRTLAFQDRSSDTGGTIVSRSWDFGDGATSTQINPIHTYAHAGTYKIVETVTDNLGASNHGGRSWVLPDAAPVADFVVTQKSSLAIHCADHSTDGDGTVASYQWDFGDGHTATGPHPDHTYAAAGTYNIVETVTDNDGAVDTKTEVFPTGTAQVIVNPSFETASFSPWKIINGKRNGVTLVNQASLASDGNYSAQMLFGADNYLYQTVSVPAGKKTATLTVHVLIGSGTPAYTDTLDVRILLPDGTTAPSDTALATLGSFTNLAPSPSYTTYSFDMRPFEGQTVVVALRTLHHYVAGAQPSDNTTFHIDNVTLTAQ